MGFFGKSSKGGGGGGSGGDAVMTGDKFFFMSDHDGSKLAICQEAGGRMAQAIAGTVKVRDDGDEVHVTGYYGEFPVRIIIWVTFANLRIQVKPKPEIAVPAFTDFRLRYDKDAAQHASEQLDRDEWDKKTDQKLFLSPHVYIEGDEDKLRNIKTLYDQLPQALTAQVLQLLESPNKGSNSLSIRKDQVEVYLNSSDITLSRSAAQRIAPIVYLLTSVAQAAAASWGTAQPGAGNGDAQAAAQLLMAAQAAAANGGAQGQAAAQVLQAAAAAAAPGAPAAAAAAPVAPAGPPQGPPPGAPAPPAPGTPVFVTWSDGNRYGGTVMQAAPGQVLVAFPNGQQQWIALGYVAAAG